MSEKEESLKTQKRAPLEPGVLYVRKLPSGQFAFVRAVKKRKKKSKPEKAPETNPEPEPVPEPQPVPKPTPEAFPTADPAVPALPTPPPSPQALPAQAQASEPEPMKFPPIQLPQSMADHKFWYLQPGAVPPTTAPNNPGRQESAPQQPSPWVPLQQPLPSGWHPMYPPASGVPFQMPLQPSAPLSMPLGQQQPFPFAPHFAPTAPGPAPAYYNAPTQGTGPGPISIPTPAPVNAPPVQAPTPAPTPGLSQAVPSHPNTPNPPTPQTPSAVPVSQVPRHKCMICGRPRSAAFHHRHPIAPGQEPLVSVCRKCNKYATSSEESSDGSCNRRRRRSRASRGRSGAFEAEDNRRPSAPNHDYGCCSCRMNACCPPCCNCGCYSGCRSQHKRAKPHGLRDIPPYSDCDTEDSFAHHPFQDRGQRGTLYRSSDIRGYVCHQHRFDGPPHNRRDCHHANAATEPFNTPYDRFADLGPDGQRQHRRRSSASGCKESSPRSRRAPTLEAQGWRANSRSRENSNARDDVSYRRERHPSPGPGGGWDWGNTYADGNPGQQAERDHPTVPRRSALGRRHHLGSMQTRTPREDWGHRHAVPAEPRREDWKDFSWYENQATFQGRDPWRGEPNWQNRRAERPRSTQMPSRKDLNRGIHYD